MRTGPYTAVREGYADSSSINDGSPSDLKYALESPTDKALAFARYQGPSPLPAVLLASRGRTPSSNRAARRRRCVCHCRHMAALSRSRTQRVNRSQWLLLLCGSYALNLLEVIEVVSREHPDDGVDGLGTSLIVHAVVLPLLGRECFQQPEIRIT